ncbi:MAG: DUF362 domain-containing protein, partial [Candidatus Riflebacteria bacterium]|nr:DUF362 domain-containing protein [Candidatus Riflebacteria bacterium]
MQPVFFTPVKEGEPTESVQAKVASLYDAAGFDQFVQPDELVAIKTHFGEDGNHNFISPALQLPLVERVKRRGARPFWTDTSTLYLGRRSNAVDHIVLAGEHGFSFEATGAPVVIADGISGRDEVEVNVGGRHSTKVGIAAAVAAANSLLVVSHATGHLACGYGGTIKNLGMGLSSRKGKLYQHSVVKPRVDPKRCRGDGMCLKWCPEDAISMVDGKARIREEDCVGCGECLAACRPGAVQFQWRIESLMLQERMAEQACGVVKNKQGKVGFVNFILNVGRDCDCLPSKKGDVLIRALGILASRDAVAIERATLQLIEDRLDGGLRRQAYDIDYTPKLAYAEELG